MSNVLVEETSLKNIANAIRGKLSECGSPDASAEMTPTTEAGGKLNMASMIKKITVGGGGECTHTDANSKRYKPNDSGEEANDENVLVHSSSLQKICNAIYAKLPGSPSEAQNEASAYGMQPTGNAGTYSMDYYIGLIKADDGKEDIRKWPLRYILGGGDGWQTNIQRSTVDAMLLKCTLDGAYSESTKQWDSGGYSYVEAWGKITEAWRWNGGVSSSGKWINAGGADSGNTNVFPIEIPLLSGKPRVGFTTPSSDTSAANPTWPGQAWASDDTSIIEAKIMDMVSTQTGRLDILVRLKRNSGGGYKHGSPSFYVVASGVYLNGDLTWREE